MLHLIFHRLHYLSNHSLIEICVIIEQTDPKKKPIASNFIFFYKLAYSLLQRINNRIIKYLNIQNKSCSITKYGFVKINDSAVLLNYFK